MFKPFRRVRNLQRYRKIVSVFARHGFGSILQNLQANRYLPLPLNGLRQEERPAGMASAEHFRQALEELGPTFVKLGQILSTRPDILPPAYIFELTKLQDSVPPCAWEEVRGVLRAEYGREPEDVFAEIDPEPLASASLAQVHAAVLPDGSRAAVKVQRPRIGPVIAADLEILGDLAGLAQNSEWGRVYNPQDIVARFAATLQSELDYRQEGMNADRFRANFEGEQSLYIPQVYWDYSTERVLALERLEGIKIDDLEGLEAAGFDRRKVAAAAARIIAKEIIRDGFFHADPHPGNFLILDGGPEGDSGQADGAPVRTEPVLGVMDFGMVGFVSTSDRYNILRSYILAGKGDARGIVDLMLRTGAVSAQSDLQGLERDLNRLLNQYRGLPLKHIRAEKMLEAFMQTAFHYKIYLPPDLWLLFKALGMMDGLARQLDSDFEIFSEFEPHVRAIFLEKHLPWVWGPNFLSDVESLLYAARDIPGIGENLLRGLQRGELPFSVNFGANKETLDRIDRVSTRLSLSLLVAAFILGLALLLPLASGSQLALALIIIGFGAALGLGVWLFVSIIRSGK